MNNPLEVTVLMPCLNESETLAICIDKAMKCMKENGINGEVLIADNGSTDGSQEIATQHGARVADVKLKGYGNALRGGINAAKGKYIIMGDSDDSYDFSNLMPFIEKLREGNDLVMGNRFKGGVKKGAMPFLHKYLGNPVLSFIGRLFFKIPIGDFHCGLRGFTKEAAAKMKLQTTGMEFASEMVVKASLQEMKFAEVPTTLSPDGRTRPPHLNTWRDGWRHLRFLLMYSPAWLFLYPGLIFIIFGLILTIRLAISPINIGDIVLDVHTMLYSASAIIIGFQAVVFFLFTKTYTVTQGLHPKNKTYERIVKIINLERGLIVGGIITLIGIYFTISAMMYWTNHGFGQLQPSIVLRDVIPSVIGIIIGVQTIFSSFFHSILCLKKDA